MERCLLNGCVQLHLIIIVIMCFCTVQCCWRLLSCELNAEPCENDVIFRKQMIHNTGSDVDRVRHAESIEILMNFVLQCRNTTTKTTCFICWRFSGFGHVKHSLFLFQFFIFEIIDRQFFSGKTYFFVWIIFVFSNWAVFFSVSF